MSMSKPKCIYCGSDEIWSDETMEGCHSCDRCWPTTYLLVPLPEDHDEDWVCDICRQYYCQCWPFADLGGE
jgi:hypothetical protein